MKTEHFHKFLSDFNLPNNGKKNVLIMDNLRVHKATKSCIKLKLPTIKELLASKGIEVIFLTKKELERRDLATKITKLEKDKEDLRTQLDLATKTKEELLKYLNIYRKSSMLALNVISHSSNNSVNIDEMNAIFKDTTSPIDFIGVWSGEKGKTIDASEFKRGWMKFGN